MLRLNEVLDFTNVLRRYTQCPVCGTEFSFTMREFMDLKKKKCPSCNCRVHLELASSYNEEPSNGESHSSKLPVYEQSLQS